MSGAHGVARPRDRVLMTDDRGVQAEESPGTRTTRLPAEPALWGVLLADVLIFTGLFAIYLSRRADVGSLFAQSQSSLNSDLAATNTLVLLTSSLFVVMAVHRFRHGDMGACSHLLRAAMFLGAAFVGLKCTEYAAMINEHRTPTTNVFYMWYFVLTGLHLAHVLVGLFLLLGMHWMARDDAGAEPGRIVLFEVGASFWHMVDLLWIVIFPLLFLVR